MITIISRRETQNPLPQYLPFRGTRLDVEKLVLGALSLFNRQVMVNAASTSYKKNECSGNVKIGDEVPNEKCYAVELYTSIQKVCKHLSSLFIYN